MCRDQPDSRCSVHCHHKKLSTPTFYACHKYKKRHRKFLKQPNTIRTICLERAIHTLQRKRVRPKHVAQLGSVVKPWPAKPQNREMRIRPQQCACSSAKPVSDTHSVTQPSNLGVGCSCSSSLIISWLLSMPHHALSLTLLTSVQAGMFISIWLSPLISTGGDISMTIWFFHRFFNFSEGCCNCLSFIFHVLSSSASLLCYRLLPPTLPFIPFTIMYIYIYTHDTYMCIYMSVRVHVFCFCSLVSPCLKASVPLLSRKSEEHGWSEQRAVNWPRIPFSHVFPHCAKEKDCVDNASSITKTLPKSVDTQK